jgi:hypothetical protein
VSSRTILKILTIYNQLGSVAGAMSGLRLSPNFLFQLFFGDFLRKREVLEGQSWLRIWRKAIKIILISNGTFNKNIAE